MRGGHNTINESNYRVRNTLEGFLKRKYEVIRRRCTNPKDIRYETCKGRLNMTWEEFFERGGQTLELFRFSKRLPSLYNQGIEIDRIREEGNYEIGNI